MALVPMVGYDNRVPPALRRAWREKIVVLLQLFDVTRLCAAGLLEGVQVKL